MGISFSKRIEFYAENQDLLSWIQRCFRDVNETRKTLSMPKVASLQHPVVPFTSSL